MICNKCGANFEDDASFCPQCGAPVERNYGSINTGGNNNNKNNITVLIIIIICLLVFIIAALAAYIFASGNSPFAPKPTPTPVPTASPIPSPAPTQPPEPTAQVIYITPEPRHDPPAPPQQAPRTYSGYETYYSSRYGFSCYYPASFIPYDDYGTLTLYTLRSPDGQGIEKIVAKPNSGETVSSSKNEYTSEHPGSITYQSSGNDYYAVNIRNGGREYYKYCKFRNGNLYWFEFEYPVAQHDIYDIYINDVYNSISYDR
ncbi:MAG: zinc ribbon domain-containing protein [Clostridiales bacterium]|nr:zinc ribbon domain-containing protein [Clostridiales bacterium]